MNGLVLIECHWQTWSFDNRQFLSSLKCSSLYSSNDCVSRQLLVGQAARNCKIISCALYQDCYFDVRCSHYSIVVINASFVVKLRQCLGLVSHFVVGGNFGKYESTNVPSVEMIGTEIDIGS